MGHIKNIFWAFVELLGVFLGLLAVYFMSYFLGVGIVYLWHLILA
jgi:hypothetical protein